MLVYNSGRKAREHEEGTHRKYEGNVGERVLPIKKTNHKICKMDDYKRPFKSKVSLVFKRKGKFISYEMVH